MTKHANFTITDETSTYVLITDEGPHDQYKTITNDAEYVVEQLVNDDILTPAKRLFYWDSANHLGEILLKDGKFNGFEMEMPFNPCPFAQPPSANDTPNSYLLDLSPLPTKMRRKALNAIYQAIDNEYRKITGIIKRWPSLPSLDSYKDLQHWRDVATDLLNEINQMRIANDRDRRDIHELPHGG